MASFFETEEARVERLDHPKHTANTAMTCFAAAFQKPTDASASLQDGWQRRTSYSDSPARKPMYRTKAAKVLPVPHLTAALQTLFPDCGPL